MKAQYDAEADALFLRFSADEIVETEEIRPGMMLDFNEAGRIVAIELLDASQKVSGDPSEFAGFEVA